MIFPWYDLTTSEITSCSTAFPLIQNTEKTLFTEAKLKIIYDNSQFKGLYKLI